MSAALGVTAAALVATATVAVGVPAAQAQAAEPTVVVEPSTDLVDGAEVTITVSGILEDDFVAAAQCTADATDIFESCDTSDAAFFDEPDASGHATMTLKVDALLSLVTFDDEDEEAHVEEVDCRVHGCAVGVIHGEDFELIELVPLHFDPAAALAPPPTLTVTPDEQLTDLQSVAVSGSGLVWSNFAVVVQCAAEPAAFGDCDYENVLDIDTTDTDSFTGEFRVSAIIGTDDGVVDCREPGACVLVLIPSYSMSPTKIARVPLHFDPDAEVVLPSVTVIPDADLVDGQTVSVNGSGFVPGNWVELYVCGPEPTWDTCQWTTFVPETDASGGFTLDVELSAVVFTDFGDEIDCRTAADPCLIVATAGSLESARTARAAVHFDPDAPLLPGPAIEVDPSTDLPEEGNVSVTGTRFTPNAYAWVQVCQTDDVERCDPQSRVEAFTDGDGQFAVDVEVAATFTSSDAQPVDCRVAPGCVVMAEDGPRRRRATAPLTFAPPAPGGERYLDPVFDEVEVTRDVVYHETTDSHGTPVELTLDIYEPAGDTAAKRPAVVWMPGGWSSGGADKDAMAGYAEAFARRGYVAVTMEYRTRPELNCCPTRDALGLTEALLDGHVDAEAGLEWLHEHAGDYRIDPQAIASGGDGFGAANAFALAFPPDHGDQPPGHDGEHPMLQQQAMEDPGPSLVAAALPISGVSLGQPADVAPPVLAFHGGEDSLAPAHLAESTCGDAEMAGSHCEVVTYAGAWDDIAETRQRDIVRRSSAFLAEMVLEPLGYLQEPAPPTTTTTTTPTKPTVTTVTSPVVPPGSGTLPSTGSNATPPLVLAGLVLAGLGATLVAVARYRRRAGLAGDQGHANVVAAVAVSTLLLGALVAPHYAAAEDPEATADTSTTVPAPADTTTSVPTSEVPTTTVPEAGGPSTTVVAPEEEQPGVLDPAAEPPDDPAPAPDPGHDPGHDPDEFPDDWTDEQVAFAEGLIADTEMALERYANPAILGLLGYVWITDGTELDGYQHWVNYSWIFDGHTLDPEFPESLVLRNAHDGITLEAAMFILDTYGMENVPDDIAWLPGWHIHDNLCWDGTRLVGIAVDGVCERGYLLVTPPMVHVWIVDTPCGRFAGVDEHGLMCDHEEH